MKLLARKTNGEKIIVEHDDRGLCGPAWVSVITVGRVKYVDQCDAKLVAACTDGPAYRFQSLRRMMLEFGIELKDCEVIP